MKIVWITPKWPFPVTDGARTATTQLVKNLTALGMEIHLCSIVEPAEKSDEFDRSQAISELGVRKVTLIRRKKTGFFRRLMHFFARPFFPITLSPYATAAVTKRVASLVKRASPDLVVYDGLHAAAWRFSSGGKFAPDALEAYRAHNVESEIWFRSAGETFEPIRKTALFLQGLLVKKLESRLVREAQFIFPVSPVDEFTFKVYGLGGEVQSLPIGIQAPPVQVEAPLEASLKQKRNILFVGKLDWAPNRDGLKWILKNVWSHVVAQASDITLTIVGSGQGSWLEAYRKLPGLKIVGQVDSLVPYYRDCIATLVPIFYGSGIRVKAIESSLYGRPCISTEIGVEGMGLVEGRDYYRAESPKEWIDTLVSLKPLQALNMGARAREYARVRFDPAAIAGHFLRAVSSWTPR
jgi:hypothetical protein